MKLATAPAQYDVGDQVRMRGALEGADQQNLKRNQDIVLTLKQRLVIPDEVTGQLYRLKIASGVLSVVEYP